MYGRKRSRFLSAFLRALSLFYGLAVQVRHALYSLGLARRKKLAQRVISVGNITLGGTGKTPTVIHIARVLLNHQKNPAVITRGYGRNDESALVVVSDGKKVLVDAASGGDEPVLIGSKLPGVPVVACSDRFRAASFAHAKFGNDTVILDDGFQHVRLRRDLDIVLVDSIDPFGRGDLFPAGILRERPAALRRAHAVLITGADRAGDVKSLKKTIAQKTGARIFTSRHTPVDLVDIVTGESRPLSALRGTTVLAFAGIARPESFVAALRLLGAEVKSECSYADHYEYGKSDLVKIFQHAADKKVSMIITTEKDAARLKNLKPDGIWALRIELKVVENKEWEALLLQGL